jgi:hypothetical protein
MTVLKKVAKVAGASVLGGPLVGAAAAAAAATKKKKKKQDPVETPAPVVEPTAEAPIPVLSAADAELARRRRAAVSRSGRQSTILSQRETLG